MIDIAESIAAHYEEILRRWTQAAEKTGSASELSQPALVNMIGRYLTALAEPKEDDVERQVLLEQHLSARLRQGFELAEMVAEISLLGQCVARLWEGTEPSERPDPFQVHQFFARLQRDSSSVTSVFTRHMLEDEQREKRFRRKLRDLAYQGLQPNAPPLAERFPEVLELVMNATESASASLIFYERESQEIMSTSAVGMGCEQMLRLAASDNRRCLAEGPQDHSDESASEHEVGEELEKCGIHSLLSVPLTPQSPYFGVILVGAREKRCFSARERRRLQSMAEQLTLHLDSARLFADLSSTIEKLDVTVGTLERERGVRELFVSVLAHDLRGPLSAAQAGAHLLACPDLLEAEDRREVAVRVNRSIDRMDRMIRDLLDVSRMRADQQLPLQLGPCDLVGITHEIVDEVSRIYQNPFSLQLEADLCGYWGADELRRALWNLITNAAKYGTEGKTITVSGQRTETGVRISVQNFGPAISIREQDHLFEPFSRLRENRGGATPGWGLGLALVRACAVAHGGKVTVHSNSASGTTFSIDLPLDAREYQTNSGDASVSTLLDCSPSLDLGPE